MKIAHQCARGSPRRRRSTWLLKKARADARRHRHKRNADAELYPALQNKAVDAAIATEPYGTLAIRSGGAVAIIGDDELIPGHQIANLLYSEEFATKRPDVALRFMKAYVRAIRFYNDALKDGRMAGPNADEVIAILTATTPIKDAGLFRDHHSERLRSERLHQRAEPEARFRPLSAAGLIKGNVTVEQVIDRSFVDAAVKALGPYQPKTAAQ